MAMAAYSQSHKENRSFQANGDCKIAGKTVILVWFLSGS
jgi:hypothetical protein